LWLGDPMIFNTIVLMRQQPWYRPGLAGVATQLPEFLANVWDLLAALGVAVVAALLVRRERTPIAASPWVPPLIAAFFLLPTGAFGANKVGGEQNSFHSGYYLVAALAALLVEIGG